MLRKFIVKYFGCFYSTSYSETIALEDNESTICGYCSWALLHSPATSIALIQSDKEGVQIVAVAEKKVQITLKQAGAADITKLI